VHAAAISMAVITEETSSQTVKVASASKQTSGNVQMVTTATEELSALIQPTRKRTRHIRHCKRAQRFLSAYGCLYQRFLPSRQGKSATDYLAASAPA
jgi:hypothetical protein